MTKGGKRYANMEQDGNWFAHGGEKSTMCTSTGTMLAQGVLQPVPQAAERYSKINPEKKTMGRDYPFSVHDNRATLQNKIETYDHVLGRKKCLDDRRQHSSHICLCHDSSVCAVDLTPRAHSAYQSDFVPRQGAESEEGTHRRRFPRSHLKRSQQAANAEESYMWFGRHDLDHHTPLNVLADSNHSSPR